MIYRKFIVAVDWSRSQECFINPDRRIGSHCPSVFVAVGKSAEQVLSHVWGVCVRPFARRKTLSGRDGVDRADRKTALGLEEDGETFPLYVHVQVTPIGDDHESL